MAEFVRQVPDGDNRERLVCRDCGHIAYENPKIVAGAVVEHDGKVLLCRRAIEPRHGFWTLPAGFMELGETVQEGAQREAREEAEAEIALDGILGVFSISRIGQVHIFFRARFADPANPHFAAGEETLEAQMFAWDDIPWGNLAFPTVRWTLDAWRAAAGQPLGAPVTNPLADPRGERRIRGEV